MLSLFKRLFFLTVALYIIIGQQAFAVDNELTSKAIGKVIVTQGTVYKVSKDGSKIAINGETPIYITNRFETAPDAKTHLLFQDNTEITLGNNTALTVDQYLYNPTTEKNGALLNIQKGDFVYISGELGNADDSKLFIRTPNGIIKPGRDSILWAGTLEGSRRIYSHYGNAMFKNANKRVDLAKGDGINIERDGTILNLPEQWNTEMIEKALQITALKNIDAVRMLTETAKASNNLGLTSPDPKTARNIAKTQIRKPPVKVEAEAITKRKAAATIKATPSDANIDDIIETGMQKARESQSKAPSKVASPKANIRILNKEPAAEISAPSTPSKAVPPKDAGPTVDEIFEKAMKVEAKPVAKTSKQKAAIQDITPTNQTIPTKEPNVPVQTQAMQNQKGDVKTLPTPNIDEIIQKGMNIEEPEDVTIPIESVSKPKAEEIGIVKGKPAPVKIDTEEKVIVAQPTVELTEDMVETIKKQTKDAKMLSVPSASIKPTVVSEQDSSITDSGLQTYDEIYGDDNNLNDIEINADINQITDETETMRAAPQDITVFKPTPPSTLQVRPNNLVQPNNQVQSNNIEEIDQTELYTKMRKSYQERVYRRHGRRKAND